MTVTEKMAREINGFFNAVGEVELDIPKPGECKSEVELLRHIKAQDTKRLLEKMPMSRSLPADAIPDIFLLALKRQENELLSKPS